MTDPVVGVPDPLPSLPMDPTTMMRCRCGAPKRAHAGRKHLGSNAATDCRAFYAPRLERLRFDVAVRAAADEPLMAAIQAMDLARPRTSKTERAHADAKWGVGPSDSGKCRKQIEYRERPPEGFEPVEVDRSAAYEGTILHDGITRARRVRYPWREFGVVVHVPGFDVPGEADEYDPVLGIVTDYKTAGTWKWDRLGERGPAEGEWDQVYEYGLALEDAGRRVEYVELHYYNRENFRDPERFRRPYSRERALAAVAPLLAVLDDLDAGRELPRDEPGPTTSALCAIYCPAVRECWGVELADIAMRSPEGWMKARSDKGVEAALEDYVENREAAKQYTTGQKEAGALVVDVPYGRYGKFTYRKTGGNEKTIEDDDARRAQLEFEMQQAIAEDRPPMNPQVMPYPMKKVTSNRATEIKRVRAALLEDPVKLADESPLAVPEGTAEVHGSYKRTATDVEDTN